MAAKEYSAREPTKHIFKVRQFSLRTSCPQAASIVNDRGDIYLEGSGKHIDTSGSVGPQNSARYKASPTNDMPNVVRKL